MTSTDSRTPTSVFLFARDTWIRIAVTVGVLGVASLFFFVFSGHRFAWGRMVEGNRAEQWLLALWTTLWLSLAAMALSLVFGVATALARLSRSAVLRQLGVIYVEAVRNTPLFVQVLFGYFVVAVILRDVLQRVATSLTGRFGRAFDALADAVENPYAVGVLVLGTFAGAYVAEIVRAAVQSIDKGQTEAALAQGMSRGQAYRLVVFPQAIRRMLPPLAGQFVSLIKDSSLLMLIPGVVELTRQTSLVRARTYLDYEPLFIALVLYFVLCFALSRVARTLELRLAA